MSATRLAVEHDIFVGGGETGARMRGLEWSATAIGEPARWHPSLRTLVGIVLGASQPMFVAWGASRTMLYNDAYVPILGSRHPDALGKPYFDVWPEIRTALMPLFEQVFGGEPIHMDDIELHLEREGHLEEAHFAFSATPIRDERGTVLGVFCPCAETTAQVSAERQRAIETERQRRLFRRAPGFISTTRGPDHVLEFVNEAFSRLFGEREWVGSRIRDAIPEVEGQGFFEMMDNVYSSGIRHVAKGAAARLRRSPSGPMEEIHVDFVYEPIIDDHGQVTGIFCEGYDVTELYRTNAALGRSEARLREVNENLERRVIERSQARGTAWHLSPDLMGALNADGFFVISNPAWETMLGWTEAEVASTPIFDLVHPDDVERTRAVFDRMHLGQPASRFINRYRCKGGGYRWISWFAVPEKGYGYCTGRDITVEREQAEALAKAEAALRQSQKMEAIGQLTGGLAHDFNNMLGSISAGLEMLQVRVGQGRLDGIERYVAVAQGGARRAAALTHRLLAFSRRQTLEPKPTNVNRLVMDMEEMIQRTVGPAICVSVDPSWDLWTTLVDQGQLENSLLNLCINARDAMPAGGRIVIRTGNTTVDQREAAELDISPGPHVRMCVTDNGGGMAPEVVARAFEPFYTTKPMGQGTGLGLSMVYGFARQSGGQVRIRSEAGRGTEVCIYLPRSLRTEEAEVRETRAPQVGPVERRATVLLVEDEEALRAMVAEAVEDLGLDVIEAEDGPAALAVLDSGASVDLLVTDIGLPGGTSGLQLAEAARSSRPGISILFVTGYAEDSTFRDGHPDGVTQVLTKPFAIEVLAERVRALVSAAPAPRDGSDTPGQPDGGAARIGAWSREDGAGRVD